MKSTLTAIATVLAIANAAPLDKRQGLSFDYNNDKVMGVNLGGWFVLEPWITPSMFSDWAQNQEVKDEYDLCKTLGSSEAYSRLSSHWNTWITQSDFQQIAQMGLNHVRIPIGYWAVNPLEGDPYVQGQLDVLDQAVGWASDANLKVLIDLHGAPGSQNGFDNSGHLGAVEWQSTDPGGDATKQAINLLAQRYASNSAVTMIELVNEPLGSSLNMDSVKQYYYDGWGSVRQNNGDTVVTIHDAFESITTYWNGFMNTASGVNNVALDTHIYQIFSDDQVAMSPPQHVSTACSQASTLASTDKWTIVGEWTGAQTDCAMWLNGLGVGARYDGTYPGSSQVGSCDGKYQGTVDALSDDDKKNLRSLIEAQLDSYSAHTGWIWWTWKTESAPEWHLQNLTAAGLFPQPISDRQCKLSPPQM
ncbi:MAG: hypothetical protein LQ340_000848 [Diploschistes diacapsis]|nr:MAG: hypothetical protein LQ340_000848 [Diploschistes diacapsis]